MVLCVYFNLCAILYVLFCCSTPNKLFIIGWASDKDGASSGSIMTLFQILLYATIMSKFRCPLVHLTKSIHIWTFCITICMNKCSKFVFWNHQWGNIIWYLDDDLNAKFMQITPMAKSICFYWLILFIYLKVSFLPKVEIRCFAFWVSIGEYWGR